MPTQKQASICFPHKRSPSVLREISVTLLWRVGSKSSRHTWKSMKRRWKLAWAPQGGGSTNEERRCAAALSSGYRTMARLLVASRCLSLLPACHPAWRPSTPFNTGPSGNRTPWVSSLEETLRAAAALRETIQKVKPHTCFRLVKVVFSALIDNWWENRCSIHTHAYV